MLELLIDCLLDALIDSAKLIPFLFVIYVLLEWFDRKAGNEFFTLIKNGKKFGPLFGGIVGVIPQCGLSASAATLYSNRIVSIGTMLAVFLSASDDMLPILLSSAVPFKTILMILGVKVAIGVVSGYIVDIVWHLATGSSKKTEAAPVRMMSRRTAAKTAEVERCTASCCRGPFWISVIKHTLQVFAYIFVLSLLLNIVIGYIGEDTLASFFANVPIAGEFVAALIGLIPNCASSVVITQLYLEGVMNAGALFAGLLVNAGVGVLILLKSNKNKKENIIIIMTLYFIGVFWGILIELLHIVF